MLGLVDYEDSDSEEEVSSHDGGNSLTVVTSLEKEAHVADLTEGNNALNNADDEGLASTSNFSTNVLFSLPSPSNPTVNVAEAGVEDELEDLVKRKKWEVKAAKKAEKQRRKAEKLRKKELKRLRKKGFGKAEYSEAVVTKKIKIEAFGALSNISADSDEEEDGNVSNVISGSTRTGLKGLLSMLPVPKNEGKGTRSGSKSAAVMLPASLRMHKRSVETTQPSSSSQTKSADVLEEDQSDTEEGSIDFFGLNNADEEEAYETTIQARVSNAPYGPSKPVALDTSATNDAVPPSEDSYDIVNEIGPSSSGVIDDSEAARIIYSHDVGPFGGTERHARAVVDDIVDVSVDQALGPNIRGNLLKNLHNKSLAEAAISHLAHIPKPKDAKDVVARRKHQITYLATMAVAREEQLAEEWSQNRHTKRMAAQKYGF